MSNLSYEESKKRVRYGLILLALITGVEVLISLFGKGYMIKSLHGNIIVLATCGVLIAGLSLYKAYFIVYEFMHMKYEVKSLAMSVILPMLLLIWAIIAFFNEGSAWKNRREDIKKRDALPAAPAQESSLLPAHTYQMEWKG